VPIKLKWPKFIPGEKAGEGLSPNQLPADEMENSIWKGGRFQLEGSKVKTSKTSIGIGGKIFPLVPTISPPLIQ
jgi:hypothetical protein